MGLMNRLAHGIWNAFNPDNEPLEPSYDYGPMSSVRIDRPRLRANAERTIISSIYTRIAVDTSSVTIEHCRLDEDGQYQETLNTGLNECLTVQANIDQVGSHLRRDMVLTLLSEGVMAVVPVRTTQDPTITGTMGDILDIRIGTIVQWYPDKVQVRVYNERKGLQEDIILLKSQVAIVENPFYAVMNEPNSTFQRLVHKLHLLDNVDDITSSGKLDLIIQFPYSMRTDSRKAQAKMRTDEIRDQLQNSTYGIAYTDTSEKITQLNRAVENNLLEQIKYLKAEVYNEMGLTEAIMNGTADDIAMLNYMNRLVEPILDAIVDSMVPKFLTKTARTQGQSIRYFQTPFKLIPISQLSDLIDVLSRNQVVTPNEIRPTLGLKPSKEPQASQLINSNMPIDKQVTGKNPGNYTVEQIPKEEVRALPAGSSSEDIAEAELDREMEELGI